jgi:type VI secretion system Hcp family effector
MRVHALIAGALLSLASFAAAAAENFYLKIPGITGEATTKAFVGWIPVTSFSEGFLTVNGGGGSGRATGRVVCQSLQVVKLLDSSSPQIALAVATGHVYSDVTLEATTAGELEQPFLRFTLHHALVSSVTFGGDSTTSARVETINFSAESVEVTYWTQSRDGSQGTPVSSSITCR